MTMPGVVIDGRGTRGTVRDRGRRTHRSLPMVSGFLLLFVVGCPRRGGLSVEERSHGAEIVHRLWRSDAEGYARICDKAGVVVLDARPGVVALDLFTGEEKWRMPDHTVIGYGLERRHVFLIGYKECPCGRGEFASERESDGGVDILSVDCASGEKRRLTIPNAGLRWVREVAPQTFMGVVAPGKLWEAVVRWRLSDNGVPKISKTIRLTDEKLMRPKFFLSREQGIFPATPDRAIVLFKGRVAHVDFSCSRIEALPFWNVRPHTDSKHLRTACRTSVVPFGPRAASEGSQCAVALCFVSPMTGHHRIRKVFASDLRFLSGDALGERYFVMTGWRLLWEGSWLDNRYVVTVVDLKKGEEIAAVVVEEGDVMYDGVICRGHPSEPLFILQRRVDPDTYGGINSGPEQYFETEAWWIGEKPPRH